MAPVIQAGMKVLTDSDYQDFLSRSGVPVLLYFSMQNCAPCDQLAPVLAEMEEEYRNRIAFAEIGIEENAFACVQFKIRTAPVVTVVKNGVAVATESGALSRSVVQKLLNSVLS